MKSLIASTVLVLMFHCTEGFAQKTAYTKPKVTSKSVPTAKAKSTTTASAKSSPTTSTHVKKTVSKAPKIKFTQDKIDFGTIKEDAVVEKTFEFTNVGDSDLLITNAVGSCGCTIPIFSITPIAPGEKGSILVKFTAKNKFGPQKPTITVTTNATPRLVKIQLEGWVDQIPGGAAEKS
jgi:Protein of unknown function (DUF1573)